MVIPTATGDLRETFDIPLMMEEATAPVGKSRAAADAVSLFQDSPPANRRPTGAEARSRTRKCPTCGGTVPAGMSLCSFCGLDLDTGRRVEIEDIYEEPPPPSRPQSIPTGILLVGGVTLVGSVVLALLSFTRWMGHQEGYEFLGLVCLFGIFASIQFLRGRSTKLLLLALTLGALVDVIALIVLPIYHANVDMPVPAAVIDTSEDADGPPIVPYSERLDLRSVGWGLGLLVAYAGVMVYLSTPGLRRHFSASASSAW